MIQTDGTITVAEAASRLHRSTEQVRRYLREGKLRGQRIGNQWFVEEASLRERKASGKREKAFQPLIPPELMEDIKRTRKEIFKRNGIVFDVVEMLRQDRESH